MKLILALAVFAALGGCATDGETPIQTKYVNMPVAAPCKADPGPEPDFSDSDAALKAAPDHKTRVRLLVAGRLEKRAYLNKVEAAIKSCTDPQ